MNINNLTFGDLKKIAGTFQISKTHSIPVGEKVFIRGVTCYYTGRVKSVTDYDLVLEEAAWIAQTGRFSAFLNEGRLEEVEPYPGDVIISLGSICEVSLWKFDLPREVK